MRDQESELGRHLLRMLEGPVITALERDDITDVHVNAGGVVRVEGYSGPAQLDGLVNGKSLRAALNLLATDAGTPLVDGVAFFSGILPATPPFDRARIQATLPPVSREPLIAIRIHAPVVYPWSSFFEEPRVARGLKRIVQTSRPNMLVIGGTGSGKTSFVNSALQLVAESYPEDRIVCLEDTPELSVASPDAVCLQTEGSAYSLEDLVRHTLRFNPRRIVVGEVRGAEAMHLIDAWSTGHEGGFGTLHANDALGGLMRLDQKAKRGASGEGASFVFDISLAVDLVVVLKRGFGKPRVVSIDHLESALCSAGQFQLRPMELEPND